MIVKKNVLKWKISHCYFFVKFCCASNDIFFKVLWSKFNFLQVKQTTCSYLNFFFQMLCKPTTLFATTSICYFFVNLCGVCTVTSILRQNLYNYTMYYSFRLATIYVKEINQQYCCPLLPRGDLPIRKPAKMVVR